MSGWVIAAGVWLVLQVPLAVLIGKWLKRRDGR